ncbi:hypothetical protein C8J56DRAFT_891346 [Mycena floridula]|nr:hypothetical protein C8J56DRAFT_891346 [Mycena floridula]
MFFKRTFFPAAFVALAEASLWVDIYNPTQGLAVPVQIDFKSIGAATYGDELWYPAASDVSYTAHVLPQEHERYELKVSQSQFSGLKPRTEQGPIFDVIKTLDTARVALYKQPSHGMIDNKPKRCCGGAHGLCSASLDSTYKLAEELSRYHGYLGDHWWYLL